MASIQVRASTGTLIIDFYFRGARCREQTALTDSAANRRLLEKLVTRIEKEIHDGTFDYASVFPNSRNVAKFSKPLKAASPRAAVVQQIHVDIPTFSDFAETWFSEKQVEWRISYQDCVRECVFQANWTVIPRQTGQQFHGKLDSDSRAKWTVGA